MNTFTIKLTEPLTVIDTKVDTLVFRHPTGEDLVEASVRLPNFNDNPVGVSLFLLGTCVTNAPAAAVRGLPAGELLRMAPEMARRIPMTRVPSSIDTSSAPASGTTLAS